MKTPHILRVEQGPEGFAPLFAAARSEGLKVGWLDLEAVEPPAQLEAAASKGALRAVAVGSGRAVSVKPIRGEPVFRDLLREHFLGCALVLVAGELDVPRLEPHGSAWSVWTLDGHLRRFDTPELLGALRRRMPFS